MIELPFGRYFAHRVRHMPRYSLRTLLMVVVFAALICMALRAPSIWWSGGLSGVLVLAVLTSVLIAVFRSGQIRAMAIGFAVFCLGYLLFEGGLWPNKGHSISLPTDAFVDWSFDKLHPRPHTDSSIVAEDPFGPRQLIERFHAYKSICIATVAFGMGVVGSAIAQMLHRTAQASSP